MYRYHRCGCCSPIVGVRDVLTLVYNLVAGRTLTSTHVSTRNYCLKPESVMKSMPLSWPASAATSSWPSHFPPSCMFVSTDKLLLQTCGGSSMGDCCLNEKVAGPFFLLQLSTLWFAHPVDRVDRYCFMARPQGISSFGQLTEIVSFIVDQMGMQVFW